MSPEMPAAHRHTTPKRLTVAALAAAAFCLTGVAPLAQAGGTPAGKVSTAALVDLHTQVISDGTAFPRFKVDAAWPAMPPELILGQVSGVSVDADDTVWLVHRPHSLDRTETGPLQNPPIADCCRPAPTVVRFAPNGAYLGGWGESDSAPTLDGVNQWPNSVHGIYVDDQRNVWIGGNGDGDHAVLNFTADGAFIRAIGRREQHGGNTDRETLGRPADIHHGAGQILIADGYSNRRLIRFNAADGAFDGYWGAYAEAPVEVTPDTDGERYDPQAPRFGDIVHCVVPTGDGFIYVCDRRNNRAQLFRQHDDGKLTFVRDIVISPASGATGTATDIALSPDGRFVYVADMVNSRIWILDRESHEPIAAVGRIGRQAGQFTWLHSIDVDSQGNLYATEVYTGRRVQKLVLTGVH